MNSAELIHALLLGIVEGLTEFLPVSSTGHLIVVSSLLGVGDAPGKVMEVVIQTGAILAVCWFYHQRIFHTVATLPSLKSSRRLATGVIVATIPAVLIGFFAQGFIKEVLFDPKVVAVMLILGGFFILWVERKPITPRVDDVTQMSAKLAFYIGLCQTVAIIPGVSRSGATIMGSLLLGVERRTAAEFSFFLAIPVILGAGAYDLYKHYELLSVSDLERIAVGMVSSFVVSLAVIRWFIRYIGRNDFTPFAWYRIFAGSAMLLYFW